MDRRWFEAVAKKKQGVKLGRPEGTGKSKLDQYRPEIEALLSSGSTQKFIAKRYSVTEATLSRWIKRQGLKKSGSSELKCGYRACVKREKSC